MGGEAIHLKIWFFKFIILAVGLSVLPPSMAETPADCDKALEPTEVKTHGTQYETIRTEEKWLHKNPDVHWIKRTFERINEDAPMTFSFDHGDYQYEHQVTEQNPRGILLRRLRKANADDWQTVLDVTSLARLEKKPWSLQAVDCYRSRCLVSLSLSGRDQTIVREFDLNTLDFVVNGFYVPEGRNQVIWHNSDTILVVAEENPSRLTLSGHPRLVRQWTRGTKLKDAKVLIRLGARYQFHELTSLSVQSDTVLMDQQFESYHSARSYLRFNGGAFHPLPLNSTVSLEGAIGPYLILSFTHSRPENDGRWHAPGTVIAVHRRNIISGTLKYKILWQPEEHQAVEHVKVSENSILIAIRHLNYITFKTLQIQNGRVKSSEEILSDQAPYIDITDDRKRKNAWRIHSHNLLHSIATLVLQNGKFLGTESQSTINMDDEMIQEIYWTSSTNHAPTPYLITQKINRDKGKPAPTIMEAYGGFNTQGASDFSRDSLELWLKDGGIYITALIRGTTERGWKENQKTLGPSDIGAQDLLAITEDLFKRGITTPEQLGLIASSTGGRWVGLAAMRQPHLFRAISCQSCIFDLVNFTQWTHDLIYVSEYGDPRKPEDLEKLKKYSPVHALTPAGSRLPAFLLQTATNDDRVSPQHSRQFAKRLAALGAEYYLHELDEGGHTFVQANYHHQMRFNAVRWSFLRKTLGLVQTEYPKN
ncbi:MAG: prolyl oligopeptidase family serine peptidase [Bdellovibrionales bacterium]